VYNHEPKDYQCPFCKLVTGIEDEINKKVFIVYEDDHTLAYIAPKWWVNNPGNVLVVPKKHVENIYDIKDELLAKVYQTAKKVALAIKETYPSDGTSMRQHNEPAGNQDVWHLHVHIFPRYKNDDLYKNHYQQEWVSDEKRLPYAEKLKNYFKEKN
jgi:histidine triad (HIT) family protein